MNRLAQEALIARLARTLREQDSWTGETHLQKATYLLRELAGVPFDFDFILYKHGPFSFELRDELGDMQADRYLLREPQVPPYGPRFGVTERGQRLESRFRRTMERYGPRVDWIAKRLQGRDVAALERLATALWVTNHLPEASAVEDRAAKLQEIKRHVAGDDAIAAVKEIDTLLASAGGGAGT
jgi:hypothetical protein